MKKEEGRRKGDVQYTLPKKNLKENYTGLIIETYAVENRIGIGDFTVCKFSQGCRGKDKEVKVTRDKLKGEQGTQSEHR